MKQLQIDEQFGKTMVLVPHQDDEILMTAGVLYALKKAGVETEVVMVTNGDYECSDYTKGRTRLRESMRGLEHLGYCKDEFTILGYADTGMYKEDSFLEALYQAKDEQQIYPSACSSKTYALEEKQEYHLECTGQHADYTRAMFYEDLKCLLRTKRPENIFTTSEYDVHGDHAALYRFLRDVLEELMGEGYQPHVYCGLVHSCAGDENWPITRERKFTCPTGLEEESCYRWEDRISFLLSQEALERKRVALAEHQTALEPNAVSFLWAFVKDEELFWQMR
jgi:LmbE family N-acetylglucosaminyl deacetylase